MRRTIIILSSLIAISTPSFAEELTWYTLPIVGLAELKDGKPSDGAIYAVQKLVESELPQLEHRYIVSVPNRVIHEMSSGTPLCTTIGVKHPDRDEVGYFVPFVPALPMHLVVRPEIQDRLPLTNGVVSFEKLIQTEGLQGVITPARTYSADLSELILLAKKEKKIASISSNSMGGNLLSMISYGRYDYTLEYPIVVSRTNESQSSSAKLISIPIAEGIHMGHAGFYCTRSSWGKNMALQLDSAIRRMATHPDQLIDLYRSTNDEEMVSRFEPQIRAYLLERAKTATEL
ncbi:hypothetical protein IB232_20020 [Pseudomonas sp. PDM15]|uniref:hypothetical protein n=1 Tax=Pseudomonas sp. PDM15 TaxID=2769303 RepID=UPI00177FFA63|nr:hypothetical protein [Pseudomonas sp. PDM15]MBD9427630.1 hypothetical protein [Pseudomonas sp. PDM15]